jgi:N-acetylmuramoyl-L-alanine amidase
MLVIVFMLSIAAIALVDSADAASYKKGSSGDMVKQIQQLLKDQGFYSGSVDGVFGSATEASVKKYQQRYGLEADGKVGTKTLAAMGLKDTGGGQSGGQNTGGGGGGNASGDVALLARLISAEARGEPYHGQVAVGAVVLNRIGHPSFPNSLSGVIYQNGAFTCIDDGQFNEPIADSAYQAARDAMNGSDPSGGAIYYFNPSTATSKWIWSRPLVVVIGKHRFCM